MTFKFLVIKNHIITKYYNKRDIWFTGSRSRFNPLRMNLEINAEPNWRGTAMITNVNHWIKHRDLVIFR
jgi:hypothetical protein